MHRKTSLTIHEIGVHVRKPVDHLVTTSARRTCRTLTWIILRPLSALSLDEGLNALSDKNPSGCWLVCVCALVNPFTSVCKYWQNKHGEWVRAFAYLENKYTFKWKFMNFLYNFLFVVYFYSNKIWCIEKLVLQYTIKPMDFTGMSTSQSTTHTSQH
jgi:hypothetical protein